MFSPSVEEKIGAYVYALIDPRDGKPFYIGKGNCNRLFAHVEDASISTTESAKYCKIREIESSGNTVVHIVIRHGLTDNSALAVESALIDFCNFNDIKLTNIVLGHGSTFFGLMTTDEILRKYNSEPLYSIGTDCVLININKTYKRGKGTLSYYEATKESWVIKKSRLKDLKFALAEFRGFVVEVFEIHEWYQVEVQGVHGGKPRTRWGFNGKVAQDDIRALYLNKSITKAKGAAFPLRYTI